MISSKSLDYVSCRCRIALSIHYHLTNCIIQTLRLFRNDTTRHKYRLQQTNLSPIRVLDNISINLHKCRYYFPKYACRILAVNSNSIHLYIHQGFLLGAQRPLSRGHVPISIPRPTTHHKILQF